jgi:hypothetical protein
MKKQLKEAKVSEISVGGTYTLGTSMGNLKKGDKVEVTSIRPFGADVKIILTNKEGVSDFFILDRNDDLDLN